MAAEALIVAVVGAESTGKTVLAQALAARIEAETGLACTSVPEHLRAWCEARGRTPRADEQAAIARAQREAIETAAAGADVVVADTTPLMTAVYSRLLFDDDTLDAEACAWQRERCAATLLTALDLPWVADGLQRDGPQVRVPVDTALRELMARHGIAWALVCGDGNARLENALDALAPLLRERATPRRGLFTRLAGRDAADRPWRCELCDDPACEHAARRR